jgi:membrane peptidoglycan carboxypeptidase
VAGRSGTSSARRAGTLLILAVVAGLLTAGLALPFVGGIGLVAKAGDNALAKLPSDLVTPPLAQHSVILAANGTTIATLAGPEDRVVVDAWQIPPVMQYAIVAIEDNRFYEHKGVDLRGLLRAASADTSSGDAAQGASTITEQYVKLVELENAGTNKQAQAAATEKSINRKLTDARLAIALEKKLTKQQILTDYLNIAYFGEGTYGIGTAAEHYFDVPVENLSLAQAATLAGLVNDPSEFDPVTNPMDSLARRNEVLDAVAKYQLQSPAAIAQARATKLVTHVTTRNIDSCTGSQAPLFCAYVKAQLLADTKLGATQTERDNEVFEGGLKIYTSYSPTVQHAIDVGIAKHVSSSIRQIDTAVSIQPGTGAILAIGQNRPYGTGPGQSVNLYAASPSYNVGSTFKAVTLTAALEQGISPNIRIESPGCFTSKTLLPEYYDGMGKAGCLNGVSNAGDAAESCDCDMYTGTWDSINTFYVQLELKVGGYQTVAATAKAMGIVGGLTFQNGTGIGPSLTLGSGGGFSAIDMATAYATLDAHGLACTPSAVTKITTLTGTPVGFTGSTCTQAVPANVADKVTSILQGVLTMPGATGHGLGIGRPAAAKTGTVDDSDEAWFVGYTPDLVTAVGVFDPLKLGSPATPITDQATGRTYVGGDLFGADIPGATWRTIMSEATFGTPVQNFTVPEATDPSAGTGSPVPDVTGLSPTAAGNALHEAGFAVQVQSPPVNSTQPAGEVAATEPAAGESAPAGSTITVLVSDGHPPVVATSASPTPTTPDPTTTVTVSPPAGTIPTKAPGKRRHR